MRVLVGQSYFLRFDAKLWAEMKPYPPLGSLYAAAVLRDAGWAVDFFDSMLAGGIDDWQAALARTTPDLVVIYDDNFNYLSKMCLLAMRQAGLAMIAAARGQPGFEGRIVICGSDATDHADIYLAAGADYVLLGEGEETLAELAGLIARDEAVALGEGGMAGLAGRHSKGEIVVGPRRPVIRDVDALPMAAWDLVDIGRYRKIWMDRHGRFSLNIATTRGCPYHCNWCAKPIWGQRYAMRSPRAVVDEIDYLEELAAPGHYWIMDDIFGLGRDWIGEFADLLERRGLKIAFKCLSRADLLLRGETIDQLSRAGCETIWIGAESGSQKILDAMEKGTEVGQIEEATRKLKQAGIRVGHFIQFGYPGEGLGDIAATLALLRRCLPDEMGISVSYPLPGTRFHDRVKAQMKGAGNWRDSDDLAMLFRGPFTTRFYRHLHGFVHRHLWLHKTRHRLWQVVCGRSPPVARDGLRLLRLLATVPVQLFSLVSLGLLALLPHRSSQSAGSTASRQKAASPTPQGAE